MRFGPTGISVTPAERYANAVGNCWPVAIMPAPGELLSSWLHRLALMSFFKDFFSHFGTPERFSHCGPPKEGARSEDVGEQALMRGLDTA